MMSEPIFYTKNYVNEDCQFALSHGADFISRIYDFDKDSQYITDGADDDDTEGVIECIFYEGDTEIDRDIDTIILVNHNLKAPTLEYWDLDDEEWAEIDALTDLDEDTTIISFTELTTSKIRIRCSTTQTPDEEKEVGEFIACGTLLNLATDFDQYKINSRQKASELQLSNGSLHRSVVMHSQYRSCKYEAQFAFKFLTTAQIEALRAIKESGESFMFQPESVSRPEEIFLVNWTNLFSYQYVSSLKTAGFQIAIEVKEV